MSKMFHFTIDCDWIPGSHTALPKLFETISRFNLRPTFFLTGRFAREYPEMVAEMRHRGYEIGCHGLNHGLDTTETFGKETSIDQQRRVLSRATEVIDHVAGVRPALFRAPKLKICGGTFEVLRELDYRLDSSVPLRRFDFGYGSVNTLAHVWDRKSAFWRAKGIKEIPPTALILPFNMRMLRLFSTASVRLLTAMMVASTNVVVFYLHPSEFAECRDLRTPAEAAAFYHQCGPHQHDVLERFLRTVLRHDVQPEFIGTHVAKTSSGQSAEIAGFQPSSGEASLGVTHSSREDLL